MTPSRISLIALLVCTILVQMPVDAKKKSDKGLQPPAIPAPHASIESAPFSRGYYKVYSLSDYMDRSVRDTNELKYLLQCSLHYAEQVHGPNSVEAGNAHLGLASFLNTLGQADAAAESLKRAAAVLPKLNAEDQGKLSSRMLDFAIRFADTDKLQLAAYLTSPVTKLEITDGSTGQDLSSKYVRLSNSFLRRGNSEQAEIYAKQAVSVLEKCINRNEAALTTARLNLASLFEKQNKYGTAIELHELAIGAPGAQQEESIKSLSSLVGLHAKSQNKEKTRVAAAKLTKLLAATSDTNDRQWFTPISELTVLLNQYGETELARQIFAAALTRAKGNTLYEWEVNNGTSSLVRQLEAMGKIDEAEQIYLLRLGQASGDQDALVKLDCDMCTFYLKHQMEQKANKASEDAISIILKQGVASRSTSQLTTLASVFLQYNKFQPALAPSLCAVDLFGKGIIKDQRTAVTAYTKAALAYNGLGERASAKAMLTKAVAVISPSLPPEFATLAANWSQLVAAQVDAGKVDDCANLLTGMSEQSLGSRRSSSSSNGYALQMYKMLGNAAESAKLHDQSCIYYKRALDLEAASSGPCSIQSASIMRAYSGALRHAGKTKEAQEFEDVSTVIRDQYVRQMRGDKNAYNPHRSLEEVKRDAHLKKFKPDSSV